MALRKLSVPKIYEDKGIDTALDMYWRITAIHGDMVTQASYLIISGYASQAARDAGKEPIETRSLDFSVGKIVPKFDDMGKPIVQDPPPNKFLFRPEVLAMTNINPVMFAYLQVKENDFFKDAEDV